MFLRPWRRAHAWASTANPLVVMALDVVESCLGCATVALP